MPTDNLFFDERYYSSLGDSICRVRSSLPVCRVEVKVNFSQTFGGLAVSPSSEASSLLEDITLQLAYPSEAILLIVLPSNLELPFRGDACKAPDELCATRGEGSLLLLNSII